MGPSIYLTMVWFGREQHVLSRRGPEVVVIVDIFWLGGCEYHFVMEMAHQWFSEKDQLIQFLLIWHINIDNVIKH